MTNQQLVDELVGNAHGNIERVQQILGAHPELVNAAASWGETPIQAAAQMGDRAMTEYLLSLGAPLDICTAAMLGRGDVVDEMLAADPAQAQATGAHGLPVMYYPVPHAERTIAESLLAAGADVNAGDGMATPLHAAVSFNQPAMARWLLDHGAMADTKDYNGKTPLELAQEKGLGNLAGILNSL